MHIMQRTLDGGAEIAGLTPIQRQLAQIMWDEPECQADEDLLAARWLGRYNGLAGDLLFMLTRHGEYREQGDAQRVLARILGTYRKANIRERRRELAVNGLFPWPQEEAERRQARSKQGAPGGAR